MTTSEKCHIEVPPETAARFSGRLLAPADDDYDEVRRVHNGLIDKRPRLIARCHGTADVRDAVRLGVDSAAEISVRGGGHNVAGKAVTDGGLMIDLAPMKGIHVDPDRSIIRAQAGVVWRELDRAGAVHGLATPGGVVSSTGIAGLTLGGGLGNLMGRYGLTIDNLLSAEVVLASGEVVIASDASHPELFWALRGGGGNFGVVTSFEYRAHALSSVLGGIAAFPFADAAATVARYRDATNQGPDELTASCGLVHVPDGSGEKIVALPMCHCGSDAAAAEVEVRRLREGAILDTVEPIPYPAVNQLLDGAFPPGALNYWKSAFLRELSDGAVATLVEAYAAVPSPMTAIVIEHLHGAATRVDPTATAFPHRQAGYSVLILGQWDDPSDTSTNIAWVRETFNALAPFRVDRRYVNYMAADDTGFVRDAYGPNFARLLEVKRHYDPGNVFRLNQNIDPATA